MPALPPTQGNVPAKRGDGRGNYKRLLIVVLVHVTATPLFLCIYHTYSTAESVLYVVHPR